MSDDPVVTMLEGMQTANAAKAAETKPAESAEKPEPEKVVEEKVAEEKVTEEKAAEEKAEPEQTDEKPEEKKPEEKPRRRLHDERRWERLVEERAYYKAQAELNRAQQQPQQKQTDPNLPSRAAFESDEEYVDALTDYKLNAKLSKYAQQQQAQAQQKALEDFNVKVAEAKGAYVDYDEVVQNASSHPLFATNNYPHVTEAVMTSDVGTDLIYYLADNPDEADKIAAMRPSQAIREIGRVESYIEMALKGKGKAAEKVAPKVSKAPAPYSSPKGTGGVSKLDPIRDYGKNPGVSTKDFITAFNKL